MTDEPTEKNRNVGEGVRRISKEQIERAKALGPLKPNESRTRDDRKDEHQ